MKLGIKLFLCSSAVLSALSSFSFGCSLAISPLRGFDRNEHIFISEVIAIVGPFESTRFRERVWGLGITVDDPIYLPGTPPNYFEVIPYTLSANCSTGGASEEELRRDFPLGSKVRVIAQRAEILPGRRRMGTYGWKFRREVGVISQEITLKMEVR